MKKLLFILLLSFTCTTIYAQVRETNPGQPTYANGDSYGYYVDNIPGAISYQWTVVSGGRSIVFDAGDRFIDIIFLDPDFYDVTCVITLSDFSEIIYSRYVGVGEEE